MPKKELDEGKVRRLCICESCPSYDASCREKGFCYPTIGKSKCIKKEKGCICPGCPVQESMGYGNVFYCTRGSDVEQFAKK